MTSQRTAFGVSLFATRELQSVLCYAIALVTMAGISLALAVPTGDASGPTVHLQEVVGTVEIHPPDAADWNGVNPRFANLPLAPGSGVRTRERSRAALRVNVTAYYLRQNSTLRLESKLNAAGRPVVFLETGSFFLANRERVSELEIHTAAVEIRPRGTELAIDISADGTTTVSVLEGEADLVTSQTPGGFLIKAGQQGQVRPGQAPIKTPIVASYAQVQWILHYAAILDLRELPLPVEAVIALDRSLAHFREGALLDAWTEYPPDRLPNSPAEAVYYSGLLFAFGEIKEAEARLRSVVMSKDTPTMVQHLARAHLQLMAAVTRQPFALAETPDTATQWLARSYEAQSQLDLARALAAARRAVEISPDFGFGLARVAELELGRGDVAATRVAIDRSLAVSPRNPPALTVRGFLLAANNLTKDALASFNQALEIDPRLGDAWLGLGLCHWRQGDLALARQSFVAAATSEPQRALLRSYLGKAFYELGDDRRALKEFRLAKEMDANDPTAWLYSALTLRQDNRINEAIQDLELSVELNKNRGIYRSQLMLDGDRAVRGANLARIYEDNGMLNRSVQEAARAVAADPANASAHLFLANSYNALRDLRQINLRYETPWLSEYLLANLLAPVGVGLLSQQVSQQEYSRLFDRDRLGLSSSTEYFSAGDWRQEATHFGVFGGTSYAIESSYRSHSGRRPNEDFDQLTVSAMAKQQLTLQDSIYLQGVYYDAHSGDVAQYFDPASAHLQLRTHESQEPILIAGYHREWQPGVHTLVLASRFQDTLRLTDPEHAILVRGRTREGVLSHIQQSELDPNIAPPVAPLDYQTELEGYSIELQQLWQRDLNSITLGGRLQSGTFDTSSRLGASTPTLLANASSVSGGAVHTAPIVQDIGNDFNRASFYAYDHWRPFQPLVLVGGVSYETLTQPNNFRFTPLTSGEFSNDRVSPKLGAIWSPWLGSSLRAAYSRGLGGVSFDQSFRLEPVQIAGFTQTFRNLAPESAVGSVSGAEFESWGLGWDQKVGASTYFGVSWEELRSEAQRRLGTIDFAANQSVSSTLQQLDYHERNFVAYANQLIGDRLSTGARYRLTDSELTLGLPEIPASVLVKNPRSQSALLHELTLFTVFQDASGFFAEANATWRAQSNDGYSPALNGDDFWQFNVFAGYRSNRRRAELRIGLINVTDQDYQLNPLTPYPEAYRDRTLVLSFKFNL